ncbi:MAG: hypothetical protein RIC30_04775 [Marinoscillum sp.]|uniref:hypothetical protein n=1 Tax=Marinoscillum sp. TaxID=2024838 RepID=UPI0033041363
MNITGAIKPFSILLTLIIWMITPCPAQETADINTGYNWVREQAQAQCANGVFKHKFQEYDCHCIALLYIEQLRAGKIRPTPFHAPKSILQSYKDLLISACKSETPVYVTGGKGPKSNLIILANSLDLEEKLTKENYRGPLSACALLDNLHLNLSSEWFLKEGGMDYSLKFFEPGNDCKN